MSREYRSERHAALEAVYPSEQFGGCACSLGKPRCDCVGDIPEVEPVETTHPWIWGIYALGIVGAIAISAVFVPWRFV